MKHDERMNVLETGGATDRFFLESFQNSITIPPNDVPLPNKYIKELFNASMVMRIHITTSSQLIESVQASFDVFVELTLIWQVASSLNGSNMINVEWAIFSLRRSRAAAASVATAKRFLFFDTKTLWLHSLQKDFSYLLDLLKNQSLLKTEKAWQIFLFNFWPAFLHVGACDTKWNRHYNNIEYFFSVCVELCYWFGRIRRKVTEKVFFSVLQCAQQNLVSRRRL